MYVLDDNNKYKGKIIPTALGHIVNYFASSGFYVQVGLGHLLLSGPTVILNITRDCEDTRIAHDWEILIEDLINQRISFNYWKDESQQRMMRLLLVCYEGKWDYDKN